MNSSRPNRKGLSDYTDSNGDLCFKLYNTVILRFNEGMIELNSGGWNTNHTKNCINDLLPSGYKLFQRDFVWYVNTPQGVIDFRDGMQFNV